MGTVVRIHDHFGRIPDSIVVHQLQSPSKLDGAVLEICLNHDRDPAPFLTKRSADEVAKFTRAPSQLFALRACYNDEPGSVLAGHYAVDHREKIVELGFDRSFVQGLGFHQLAIDLRLYCIAMEMNHAGIYPDRSINNSKFFPVYASIEEDNTASRNNYSKCGALELATIPECMRNDRGSGPLSIPGLVFPVFTPENILAGYDRTRGRMRDGKHSHRNHSISVDFRMKSLFTLEASDAVDEEVRRIIRIYQMMYRQMDMIKLCATGGQNIQ